MVSGLVAANAILGRERLDGVVPVAPDEPHVGAGRALVKGLRQAAPWLPSPLSGFVW